MHPSQGPITWVTTLEKLDFELSPSKESKCTPTELGAYYSLPTMHCAEAVQEPQGTAVEKLQGTHNGAVVGGDKEADDAAASGVDVGRERREHGVIRQR